MSAGAGVCRAGLLPLTGREVERTVVDNQLRALAAGQGGALLLQGEAGIGKSRLLTEALTLAAARGIRVASGAAQEHERERPLPRLRLRSG